MEMLPHLIQKDFMSLYIKLKVWGDSNPFSYAMPFAFAAFFERENKSAVHFAPVFVYAL
jgi:hypothetical protein